MSDTLQTSFDWAPGGGGGQGVGGLNRVTYFSTKIGFDIQADICIYNLLVWIFLYGGHNS